MEAWVKVEDRLPEFEKDVLLWCGWAITGIYRHNRFVTEDGSSSVEMVTHWHELPAPPQPITEAEQITETHKRR